MQLYTTYLRGQSTVSLARTLMMQTNQTTFVFTSYSYRFLLNYEVHGAFL